MSTPVYMGVDLGTTRIKVGLFDAHGTPHALTSREFHIRNPQPGFAEFDGEFYASLTFDAMREMIATCGTRSSVRGIGLSSQAQTFLLLDRSFRPVRPAISWLDVRATAEAEEFGQLARQVNGPSSGVIASGPKILWVLRHEPEIMARVQWVLMLPDYLIFRLTGKRASDVRTAESTACYDRRGMQWIAPLLTLCGLTQTMMPSVGWPGERVGDILPDVARELGFDRSPAVALGAMDQLAGALGTGNVQPGIASVSLGTALSIVTSMKGEENPQAGTSSRPHPVRGLHALLAYAKTAGIVIRWFRDTFMPSSSFEDFFREAVSVPVGCDGVTCLPHFSGTATPTFDPSVRGAFAGLALHHTRAHLARAIAEALAFTVRENLEFLKHAGVEAHCLRVTGGGAASDAWLQMIADATGIAVERPMVREAACFGAAQLAMFADGVYGSIAEASETLYRPERRFDADVAQRDGYEAAFVRYGELSKAIGRQEKRM